MGTFIKLSQLIGLYLTFFIYLFLAGCDVTTDLQEAQRPDGSDLDARELAEQSLTWYDGKPYSDLPIVQNAERLENDLSDIYEGFGGVWRDPEDDYTIVIALRKGENFEANRENIMSRLQSVLTERVVAKIAQNEGKSASEFKFRTQEVANTYLELQKVRDLLTPVIHQRDDIVESFIDAVNNTFTIGLLEDKNRMVDYNNLLDRYSINKEKVAFFETGSVEPDILSYKHKLNLRNQGTLREWVRPLRGGLQFEGHNPLTDPAAEFPWVCTFGFNA